MFLSAADEAFMPPAVNYAILSFLLSAIGYLDFDPQSFKQAIECPEADKWWTSMDAEMSGLDHLSTFTWVQLPAVPAGVHILSCKWVSSLRSTQLRLSSVVTNMTLMIRLPLTLPPSRASHFSCSLLWLCTLVGPFGRWMVATHS